MRTLFSSFLRGLGFSPVTAVALLAGLTATASATPTVTVSSSGAIISSIAANSTAKITVQISGLTSGATVRVNRYRDPTGSGVVNPSAQVLVQSFLVTDGQLTKFGGVIDPKIPGDTDGVADGNIAAKFSIQSQADLGQLACPYVIQVTNTSGTQLATTTLSFIQPAYTQSISGQITNSANGQPVPYAEVVLISTGHNGEFVGGALADNTGHYFIQAAPGSYGVLAGAAGFVCSPTGATLASGVNQTGINLPLTPATGTITTQVADASGSPLLPAVGLFVQSQSTGLFSLAASDINGNVVIPVTSASDWNLQTDENSLDTKGYMPPQNGPTVDTTTSGSPALTATQSGLLFTPANALIWGTLKDSNGNAIPGVDINDSDNNGVYNDDFLSSTTSLSASTSSGSFFLLAVGPLSGSANWQVQTDNNSPALAGYVAPQGTNASVVAGMATQVNFVATAVSSFLNGTVTNNGTPVSGVTMDAQPQNGGSNIQTTTDGSGNFSLGVGPGTWNISLDNNSADQDGLVGPQLTESVSSDQTISNIAYPVLNATATVSGTVTDPNVTLSSNDNVFATATINSLQYSLYASLSNNDTYSFPLIDGSWTFGVSGQNGPLAGIQQTTINVTTSQTLNLAPLQATAHFTGTVTNNGIPVTGVTIDAAMQDNNNDYVQATTDGSGNFNLGVTAGTWNIYLDSESVTANNLVVPQLTETIADGNTISSIAYPVLSATATVSGTVKDADGNPLPSSDNVFASATISGLQYNANAQLDNNGNYSLQLVNGTWNFSVSGPNGTPPGFQQTTVTISGNQTVNLAPVVATATFAGTVTNNSTPVSGLTVDATLQNGNDFIQATTDTNGNFSLGVTAGTWNVQVDSNSAAQNNLVVPGSLNETIITSQTISGLNIPVLTATATVSGTVTDANGDPLSSPYNVSAQATINNVQYNADVNLGNNGGYSLPLVNGSWTFAIYGPGGQVNSIPQTTVTVSGNQTLNLAPPQATAHFTGTVMNSGNPVVGVIVDAALQSNNGTALFQATTDSGGNFNLGVTAGTWDIYLNNNGVAQQNLVASVINGETITNSQTISGLVIQALTGTGTISGTVSDYNGNLVTGGGNVGANANVNGVVYVIDLPINNNGSYSLNVVNGTWNVQPSDVSQLNFNTQTVSVTGTATLNFVASVINGQPTNQSVNVGQGTSFTVGINSPGSAGLQWQVSTNGGGSWSPTTDNSTYSGTTSNTLSLNNATTALNGAEYECVVSFTYSGNLVTETSSPATLTVSQATANVTLGNLSQAFTGAPCVATATTSPPSLTVNFTYNGSPTAPTQPGSYSVIATVSDPNYTGSTSGTLTIQPDFDSYLSQNFPGQLNNPAVTGPTANPAGDGMPNLLKYALGLNPTQVNAASGAPVTGQSSGSLTLTYVIPPGLTDITYIVEVSSDLQTWNSGPGFTQLVSSNLLDAQHQQIVVRDLALINGNLKRFIRLRVTQP